MIHCVINAPEKTITGAFTILFAFSLSFEGFFAEDIQVKTIEGDPLGDPRDNLKGRGNHYALQCYVPPNTYGKSEISLDIPDVAVKPVEIVYDTVKVVSPEWGTPVVRGSITEVPITFDVPLRHLRKRHFRLLPAVPYQIYRSDQGYRLSVKRRGGFSVTVRGQVIKSNGVESVIKKSVLEV